MHRATPADVPTIVAYIEKKADFDRELGCFAGVIDTTAERIHRALFGQPVFAHALLALDGAEPVGFAFFHFRFSSFRARPSLWLDDLFIDGAARRSGAGQALMGALAAEAEALDCSHLGWGADAGNPSGVPFYTKLGAEIVPHASSSLTYRITPVALAQRLGEIGLTG